MKYFKVLLFVITASLTLQACICNSIDCAEDAGQLRLNIVKDGSSLLSSETSLATLETENGDVFSSEIGRRVWIDDSVLVIYLLANNPADLAVDDFTIGTLELFTSIEGEGRCCTKFQTDKITLDGMEICSNDCNEVVNIEL